MMSNESSNDGSKVGKDLDELYGMVVKKADDSIAYYSQRKSPKRFWAQVIRFFSIVLLSLAGLVPLVDSVMPLAEAPAQFDSGQVALLIAAIAAALLGMDKFFGFSSSWTRFILAELKLQKALDRFHMDWAMAEASPRDRDESSNDAVERLQLLRNFSMELSQIAEEETQVWISEYQSALVALEKFAKEREETSRAGALQIRIQRGAEVAAGVAVMLDGIKSQETGADITTVRSVLPGLHEVQLIGKSEAGEELTTSQMVTVPSGGVASVALQLG